MTVLPRVRQPLHQQHARALGPTRTIRIRRERLAPPISSQPTLTTELHKRRRSRHHRHTARERQRTLTVPQRLHRQMQRHQRRRTRRVHRDRRPLKAKRVRQPTRNHTRRITRTDEALHTFRKCRQRGRVVVVHHTGEHTGTAAAQHARVDARPLERLPRRLQQQPLLRIHGEGLTRRDPEEARVEMARPVDESALSGVRGARVVGVRVVEPFQIPATVGRELGDRVPALQDQPPQILRSLHPTRITATQPHDRDRLIIGGRHHHRTRHRSRSPHNLRTQELGEHRRRRIVEDQRRGQPQLTHRTQRVPQLHRRQRVKAQLTEGAMRFDGVQRVMTEYGRDLRTDQLQQGVELLSLAQPGEPPRQRARRRRTLRRTPRRNPHQAPQQRRHHTGRRGLGAHHGQVEPYGDEQRLVRAVRGVEQLQTLGRRERHDATPAHPGHIRVVQLTGHAAGVGPQAPGQRGGRQATGPAVLG